MTVPDSTGPERTPPDDTTGSKGPMSVLQFEIEHARRKLAEYEASRATSDYSCSNDNVLVRYGYLMRLLQSLVEAYDAERAKEPAR